jgi:hypothetical protein
MLMMDAGRVVEAGPPRDVLASGRPRSQQFFARHFRGWGDLASGIGDSPAGSTTSGSIPSGGSAK